MNRFKKYFLNTSVFNCPECCHWFKLSFWKWFFTLFHNHITRHAYVKCPHCGVKHWLQAEKMVD